MGTTSLANLDNDDELEMSELTELYTIWLKEQKENNFFTHFN